MKLFLTRNAGQCFPICRVSIAFLISVHFVPPDMKSLTVLLNTHSTTSYGRMPASKFFAWDYKIPALRTSASK